MKSILEMQDSSSINSPHLESSPLSLDSPREVLDDSSPTCIGKKRKTKKLKKGKEISSSNWYVPLLEILFASVILLASRVRTAKGIASISPFKLRLPKSRR